MKNFLFLYRSDFSSAAQRSPEEMQNNTKMWMDWIGGIAAQNKLADRGNRLEQAGKVVRPNNVVTDGPFTEIKETLGGYTVIQASSLEEAAELAQGCPILAFGGNVEIREISVL
ncbi:YCII-related domain-containing protein [Chitinophaga eiseniae]|uniref:YCII-related domain-containing protein n=1 Tax=Chitinophaga eiseniae TaxID=634771 RepID=A0A1T4TD29_9BACT|nr:YciI family protein [Chitinophaga eiseniae]SKA38276.1 YCII-related domain-containing protein [Chitinophaga eiseniae]